MHIQDISYKIRAGIFEVYNQLGPGLLESVYKDALRHEIDILGLKVKVEVPMPFIYKEIKMNPAFRADLVVEDKVLIEIKSVEHLLQVHHKQVITYLKLSGITLGILVNFNSDNISQSIFRKVNGFKECH